MPKIKRNLSQYKTSQIKVISSNEVVVLNKKNSENNPKRAYFFKKIPFPNAIKEAISSAFYRILIGSRAAEVSLAINLRQDCEGSISKEIPGFTEANANTKLFTACGKDFWIKVGLARILVSSYVFAENDLCLKNWGFDNEGNAVRIDFECSLNAGQQPVMQKDILNILQPQGFTSNNWPQIAWDDQDKDLDQKFNIEKWHYFLKSILLSEDLFHKIASNYNPARNISVERLVDRLQDLKVLLMSTIEFKEFLSTHPECIDRICDEFKEYNKLLKPGQKNMIIDISEIKAEYVNILNKMGLVPQVHPTIPDNNAIKFTTMHSIFSKPVEDDVVYKRNEIPSCPVQ